MIIYEGNVEQFSFYFFSECRLLFSATFAHKMGRCFMLLFFFVMLVFSVSGLTLFFVHYKKLAKYFMEDYEKITLKAIMFESFEKSIFPLLFGCFHALLIDRKLTQTIVLGGIEFSYFIIKMFTLNSRASKSRLKIILFSLSSLLRLVLIFTLYLYEYDKSPFIINLVHHDIIWLYIIFWLVETIYDMALLIV